MPLCFFHFAALRIETFVKNELKVWTKSLGTKSMNKILYANILSKVQNFTHQTKLYKYARRDVKHENFWVHVI